MQIQMRIPYLTLTCTCRFASANCGNTKPFFNQQLHDLMSPKATASATMTTTIWRMTDRADPGAIGATGKKMTMMTTTIVVGRAAKAGARAAPVWRPVSSPCSSLLSCPFLRSTFSSVRFCITCGKQSSREKPIRSTPLALSSSACRFCWVASSERRKENKILTDAQARSGRAANVIFETRNTPPPPDTAPPRES